MAISLARSLGLLTARGIEIAIVDGIHRASLKELSESGTSPTPLAPGSRTDSETIGDVNGEAKANMGIGQAPSRACRRRS